MKPKQIKVSMIAKLLGLTRGRLYQIKGIPLVMDKPKIVGVQGIKYLEKKGYNCEKVWEYFK